MSLTAIDSFKKKALGHLIKKGLEIADHYQHREAMPDMAASYRLLAFVRSIKNNYEVYTDDELLSIIDWYGMEIGEDYLAISSSFNDVVVEMIEQNYLSVPSGGGTGFYLSKNSLGQLAWIPNETSATVAELVSGKGRVTFISGKWYLSSDSGTTIRRIATINDLANFINDGVASFDSTLSSKKITELLAKKVDEEVGKGLSTNDLTDGLLAKINKIVTNGTTAEVMTATGAYEAIGDVLAAAGISFGGGDSVSAVGKYDTWGAWTLDDSPRTDMRFYFIKDATAAPFYADTAQLTWALVLYSGGSTEKIKVVAPLAVKSLIKSDAENADLTNTDTEGVLHDGTAPITKIGTAIHAIKTAWNNKLQWLKDTFSGGFNIGLNVAAPTYGIHQLGGGHKLQALTNPVAPTITNVGTAGITSYTYFVVAEDRNGFKTLASTEGTTTTGNAILDATNYNTISWTEIVGAVKYYVLKTDTGTLLGSTVEVSFNDQGQATSVFTAPTRNETADLRVDGKIFANGTEVGEGGGTGGHTITDGTTSFTQRAKLEFTAANITDDSTNDKTVVGNATSTKAGLMSAADKVKADKNVNGEIVAFAATNTYDVNKVMIHSLTASVTLTEASSGNVDNNFATYVITGDGASTVGFGTGWKNENDGVFNTTTGKVNVIRMHYLNSTHKFYTISQPA